MKKTFIVILVALLLTMSLAGCGKSVAEGLAEGLIKKATGADVNVSGDGVTVKGQDGSSASLGGDLKWPSDKMGDLPELKGNVTATYSQGAKAMVVTMDKVTKDDATAYVQKLKDMGYESSGETNTENGTFTFTGKKGSYSVTVWYVVDDNGSATCMITLSQEDQ